MRDGGWNRVKRVQLAEQQPSASNLGDFRIWKDEERMGDTKSNSRLCADRSHGCLGEPAGSRRRDNATHPRIMHSLLLNKIGELVVVISAIDSLASKRIARVVEMYHRHVMVINARNNGHMPDLMRMTPPVKDSRKLLLGEPMSVEQQSCQVSQARLAKGCDKVPCVEGPLHVGDIGQGHDARAGHSQEDKDSEVAEAGEIEKGVKGQDAADNAHPERERQKDPPLNVAKKSIVQCCHDRGCDENTDPNIVQCGGTAHYGQTRVAEEGVIEGRADETLGRREEEE